MSDSQLTPDERFLAYYDRLREEINTAYTHHEIAKCIREAKQHDPKEFSEAITFFQLTMLNHLFSSIMAINRFIDYRDVSLHLKKFFAFLKSNLYLFSTASYKNRLLKCGHDTEDCEHFCALHHEITSDIVEQDKAKMNQLPIHNLINGVTKSLRILRGI